jgi:hypothetical protein
MNGTTSLALLLLAASPTFPQDLEPAPNGDQRTLVVYDIGDLTGADELGEIDLAALNSTSPGEATKLLERMRELEEQRELAQTSAQTLLEAVKAYLEPEFKPSLNELRLLSSGSLLLFGDPGQHTWCLEFMGHQRRTTGFILLEAQLITVPAGTMAKLGVEGSITLFSGEAGYAPIRAALLKNPEVQTLNTPKVLTRPRQSALISVENQVAYVKDYKIQVVEPGALEIADPVIDVVTEGLSLEILGVPLGQDLFGVDLELENATLTRPIRTVTRVIHANRDEVQIGLPEVTKVRVESRLAMRSKAIAVIVTPDPTRDVDLVVTIRMQHLQEEDLDQLGPEGEK